MPQRESVDELHFKSMDDMIKRIDDRMWVAKGKPRMWATVYDHEGVTVWIEAAYGGIKLQTPNGVSQGQTQAALDGITATHRRGQVELKFGVANDINEGDEDILELTEEVH